MAVDFNGTSDRIALSEPAFDIERTQAFTLALWVYPNVLRSGGLADYAMFSKLDSAAPNSGIEFSLVWFAGGASRTQLNWYIVNNIGSNYIGCNTSTTDIPNSVWTHVALTYDGSSTAAGSLGYIGGSLITKFINANTLSATVLNNITPHLGSRNAATTFYNGTQAEFGCWTAALDAAEIAALARGLSPAAIRPNALLSYIPLVRAVTDYMGAASPVASGTTVQPHPRIIKPKPRTMPWIPAETVSV